MLIAGSVFKPVGNQTKEVTLPVSRTVNLEPGHVAIILHHGESPIYVGPGTGDCDDTYSTTITGRALFHIASDVTGQMTMEAAVLQVLRDDGADDAAVQAVMSAYAKNFDVIHNGGKL